MQHKARHSRLGPFLLGLVAVIVGGLAVLMTHDIPAPQKPVEKQLDAKALLEQK